MKLDITSVSRRPEPYQQAAAAIQVITQEDIRRSGASSIPEALRLANNLQVAQIDSHSFAISARGFNSTSSDKLLVMIDGRSVYTTLFSGVFWDVQDYLLEDLDRIEVISGPGATLWGANAVNGVINIVSKSAKDTQGLLLTGGGGTELRDFGGLRYGGTLASNVFYRVYGKYFDRDSSAFANGKDGQDDWRMGRGGFRLDWEASERDLFTFQGDGYGGTENRPIGDDLKISGGNILGRWSRTVSDDSNFSLQLYYDRTHRDTPGTFVDDLDTYDLDFQHQLHWGDRQNIVWGLGYTFTHDVLRGSPGVKAVPSHLGQHVYSGFIQDEITLLDNLFFTLGTKVEHNDYTHLEFEPSARLAWNVTTNQTIWSAVSRAVRTPSRIDKNLFAPANPPFVVLAGGHDFVSETVLAYELGYRVQLNKRISGSVSTFYNVYDHIRTINPTTRRIENDVDGETYGVETDVSFQVLDCWRLRAGYTVLQENIHLKSGGVDVNRGLAEKSDPQQQVSFRSSLDLPGRTEFDLGLRWVDRLRTVSNGTIGSVPSYFSMDARFAWHATENLEFSIVGQNLLDNQHPEFGFPNANRHEIERSVYGKVTWRF
jgi:iron complex outermembrane receptor protein